MFEGVNDAAAHLEAGGEWPAVSGRAVNSGNWCREPLDGSQV